MTTNPKLKKYSPYHNVLDSISDDSWYTARQLAIKLQYDPDLVSNILFQLIMEGNVTFQTVGEHHIVYKRTRPLSKPDHAAK